MLKISGYGLLPGRHGHLATEILVISLVLALLAGLVTANVTGGMLKARKTVLASTLGQLQAACDAFRAVCGDMPVASIAGGPGLANLIDLVASDHGGNKIVPSYLRHAPATRAHIYGLSVTDGPLVYFGITPEGRVFATQEPPDAPGGWTLLQTPVFVAGSTEAVPYADIGGTHGPAPGPVPPPMDVAATIELVSSRGSANTGEDVRVTATALTADGRPVAGVLVSFEISGSATGTRCLTGRTDDLGRVQIEITTAEPEIVVVHARAP